MTNVAFFSLFSEIARVRASLFQINGVRKEPLQLPEPDGETVTLNEKVYVPVKEHPDVSIHLISSPSDRDWLVNLTTFDKTRDWRDARAFNESLVNEDSDIRPNRNAAKSETLKSLQGDKLAKQANWRGALGFSGWGKMRGKVFFLSFSLSQHFTSARAFQPF